MKYLYILLFIGFSNYLYSTEISSPVLYKSQDFDVLHYNAIIEFSETQRKLIYAKNEIILHWLKRSEDSKFYFHLRSLSVDKVEYNGKLIDFRVVGVPADATYHFEITPFSDDLTDTAIVTIYYHGIMQNEGGMNPWGGVHDRGAVFSLGVGFYCNYVSTTQHWLACYDHPSDKATFKFTFINPLSKFIISNGNFKQSTIDGKNVFVFESDKPIATYLMTFADYNYEEHSINYKIPIRIYADNKYSSSIQKVFSNLPKIVDIYESIFGEYPFELIGYVLTPLGSMESQMMINLDEKVFENAVKNSDTLNLTIAHELSHQWFGNSVTPYDFRDAYLNESWATYSESLLLEKFYNKSSYLKEQEKKLNLYVKQISPFEGYLPLYDFSRKSPSSNYPTTIYYKGAVVMGMLRHLIDKGDKDNLFFNFIKDFLESNKYKNVSSLDFKNTVLKYTADSVAVNRFFDSWIYKAGYPQFDVQFVRNYDGEGFYQDILLRQNNPKSWGLFDQVPIPIRFVKGMKQFDTVIWIYKASPDYISLSHIIGINKVTFDTVYFNSGNTIRSLFTINKTQVVEPNNIIATSIKTSFFVSNKILTISLLENTQNGSLLIYDLYGRLVGNYSNISNSSINIDLNYLPYGFYNFVILKNGILIYHNKFLLN